ncbi:hypothetical protein CL614_00510 [archaeon]|nr:hypothetical protein [archaeon]|tara:strand:- start:1627 stop:2127 length:501 start_codon:yes stop_codon:yes gene_type:complete
MNENTDFIKPEPREIKEKQKKKWIKAWFAIEVVAIGKEIAEQAIRKHMERMSKAKSMIITDIKYSEPSEAQSLPDQIKKKIDEKAQGEKAYSVSAEISFMCKNMTILLELVMMYGPSAIEILEPKEVNIPIDEIQNIANVFSGILHQFAASGIGGLVISTDKKDKK